MTLRLSGAFAARGSAVAGALLFHLLVSRVLDLDGSGLVFVVVTWSAVLSIPARLGLDGFMLALFPRLVTETDTDGALRTIRTLRWLVVVAGLGAAAVVFLAAQRAVDADGGLSVSDVELLGVSMLVVPYSLTLFNVALHKSLGHAAFANAVEGGAGWALSFVCIAGFAMAGVELSVVTVLVVALAAHGLLLTISTGRLVRPLPRALADVSDGGTAPPPSVRSILRRSVPFVGASGLSYLLVWLPVLAMGWTGRLADVSKFNAIVRVGSLVPFGLSVMNVAAAPRIAALHHRGDTAGLQVVAWQIAGRASAFGALVVVVVVGVGAEVLAAFGSGYGGTWPLLVVFVLGQMVNASMGASGYLLQLTGSARTLFRVMLWTVGTFGVAGAVAGAVQGVLWAVVGVTIALVVQNLAVRRAIQHRLGVDSNPRWVSHVTGSAVRER